MTTDTIVNWEKAETEAKTSPTKAIQFYNTVLSTTTASNAEEDTKRKEMAINKLGDMYGEQKQAGPLADLIRSSRPILIAMPKAKAAKIVRTLLDVFEKIPNSAKLQVELCKELIDWSVEQKRIYLKQSLETKLVALYLESKMYTEALALIAELLRELKRLDDKMALVEVQLLESRCCLDLKNIPKSKAALTSARTSANAIYCPPLTQAGLDIQSGILHAEEKDFKTAFSYFFEALEGFSSQDDPRAILALKYMLLCKIMLNNAEDVHAMMSGKMALRYAGDQLDAMRAVALAYQHRSLNEFEAALDKYQKELKADSMINSHLTALYDNLLEQNLARLIEPFSRVEIAHVAKLINLPVETVEKKLSQMILDKVLHGILDQGEGHLELFDEQPTDSTYEAALETIKSMGHVVDSLYLKASKLS